MGKSETRINYKIKLIWFFIPIILILAACSPSEADIQNAIALTEEARPTDTPAPTRTQEPTETPEPSNTPTYTPTPIPTNTPTPEPTSTSIPTETPDAAATQLANSDSYDTAVRNILMDELFPALFEFVGAIESVANDSSLLLDEEWAETKQSGVVNIYVSCGNIATLSPPLSAQVLHDEWLAACEDYQKAAAGALSLGGDPDNANLILDILIIPYLESGNAHLDEAMALMDLLAPGE